MEKMTADNEIPFAHADIPYALFQNPRQAERTLDALRSRIGGEGFDELLPSLRAALPQVADQDMALNFLERFVSELAPPDRFLAGLRTSPAAVTQLLGLFGASNFLAMHCVATASETFDLLCSRSYLASPTARHVLKERLTSALNGTVQKEELYRALRLFRKRELVRIALRDLLGKADLSETVDELSCLAEVCLQAAYERLVSDLDGKYGRPMAVREDGTTERAGFTVIGMGKLGGSELNFSSDVDLMYVYSVDGETEGVPGPDGVPANRITNHQYFVKLGEQLSAAIGQSTADGFVFRVDLRLRPEGQRGPLAQSLGGYEIYYESWGQTWERSALIKARSVAGDERVGREFIGRMTPFVYRKYLDFSAIAEIREMKQKINRDVQQKGRDRRDVKLGYGGIREIEFLVQALQLIYGGRDRALRERGTMRALHVLSQKGLLSYQETADLMKAYAFLRTVEHRLQMLNDLQTQVLPAGEAELRLVARRSGYLSPGREAEQLLSDYGRHTRNVRTIYDDLLGQTGEDAGIEQSSEDIAVLLDAASSEQDAEAVLARSGFHDPARALRNLLMLREGQAFMHQTPRSRRVFEELFPAIYRDVTASPDPDMALHHLESYLAAQGSWDAFHAFIRQDPRLLSSMVTVFGSSEYFSRMLIRTPPLLEELLVGTGRACTGRGLRTTLDAAIGTAGAISDKLDALRRFKNREELRIGMVDLAGGLPLPAVARGISRIAEACLDAALRLAVVETSRRFGGPAGGSGLAIMGAGKLGGRELIYGSDLDILFVFDEHRAGEPPKGMTVFEYFSKVAEKTISYLTTMTREGAAYRVDTRLRPTGSKGPLVQSVEAYRSHFSAAAVTWERQALINARFVAGDGAVAAALAEAVRGLLFRDDDPAALAADIGAMRKRMEDELAKEDERQYNIKQGSGGLVDIEFLVQYLQLRYGRQDPRLQVPGTINALRALNRSGVLGAEDADRLRSAYQFLRMLENRLRIVTNQSKSILTRDGAALRTLAKRMGYDNADGSAGNRLLGDYERLREEVRSLFDRTLGR